MLVKPAIIWALEFHDGKASAPAPDADIRCDPGEGEFRWLHLNLADQWTPRWIEASCDIPAPMRQLLLSPQRHQQAIVERGYVGSVLHDIERDFDRLDAGQTGALRLVLGPNLMITARHHPLHSADIVRERLERGDVHITGPAAALELAVSAILDNVAQVVRDQASAIEALEDVLLDRPEAFDQRQLIALRRRTVHIHRLLTGLSATFMRLEEDTDLPPELLSTVENLSQRLGAVDGETLSIQAQLRSLREEADLQATRRTNQNLYVLSILSALLLPATLVTGFFGMNTSALPFAHDADGTLLAGLVAIASSLAVYLLLRRLGFIRRS